MTGGWAARALLLAAVLALAGCSEYLDRRDTISLNGGDAVATNKVTQMVDPWPPVSANRDIAFNGVRMRSAVDRYKANKIIEPQGIGTTSNYTPPAAAETPQTQK
jgi:hypothetical protein